MEYQATSSPYSPDTLAPHDRALVWSRDFGTNTTDDRGDDLDTGNGTLGPITASIDARLAMLRLQSLDAPNPPTSNGPRGRTWLLPPWPAPVLWPSVGIPLSGRVLFARILQSEISLLQTILNQCRTQIVVGPAALVGLVPAVPFGATGIVELDPTVLPATQATRAVSSSDEYQGGGQIGPTLATPGGAWGPDVYVRMVMLTDTATFTVVVSWLGTGLCWAPFQPQAFFGFVAQRVGMVQRGLGVSLLDWIRVYQMEPIVSDHSMNFPDPPLPVTGGRLFIP